MISFVLNSKGFLIYWNMLLLYVKHVHYYIESTFFKTLSFGASH